MIKTFIQGQVSLSPVSETVRSILSRSNFDFYLSGSFFFKEKGLDVITETSDIDFATFYSPTVENFLIDQSFERIHLSYNDGNTASVWRKFCDIENRFVEVSLKLNLSRFLRILDSLSFDTIEMISSFGKRNRVFFWRSQYDLFERLSADHQED